MRATMAQARPITPNAIQGNDLARNRSIRDIWSLPLACALARTRRLHANSRMNRGTITRPRKASIAAAQSQFIARASNDRRGSLTPVRDEALHPMVDV